MSKKPKKRRTPTGFATKVKPPRKRPAKTVKR